MKLFEALKLHRKGKIKNYDLIFVIAPPGTGKSSYAQHLITDCNKKNIPVWSNKYFKGAYHIKKEELKQYKFLKDDEDEGFLILDEAGTLFPNREWAKADQELLEFFREYRHQKLNIVLLSQKIDIDKAIFDLVTEIYVCKRHFIFWLLFIRLIPYVSIENGFLVMKYDEIHPTIFDWFKAIPIYKSWQVFNSYEIRKKILAPRNLIGGENDE